jgi:hypothetical protein
VTDAIELAKPARPKRHLLVVCALLAAAARFVPVPLLDDVLRERIRQYLVSRLLDGGGRTFSSGRVGPLWKDEGSCTSGCLALLWKVPLAIVLFPIRKIVAIVTAVRGFARDVTEALLFGRALDRALVRGLLAEGSPEPTLHAEALVIRRAFDHAAAGADTRIVSVALADALRGIRGLPRAALRAARSLAKSGQAAAPPKDQVVEQGAGAVEQTLDRPDVARVLADFDARFDAALGP